MPPAAAPVAPPPRAIGSTCGPSVGRLDTTGLAAMSARDRSTVRAAPPAVKPTGYDRCVIAPTSATNREHVRRARSVTRAHHVADITGTPSLQEGTRQQVTRPFLHPEPPTTAVRCRSATSRVAAHRCRMDPPGWNRSRSIHTAFHSSRRARWSRHSVRGSVADQAGALAGRRRSTNFHRGNGSRIPAEMAVTLSRSEEHATLREPSTATR